MSLTVGLTLFFVFSCSESHDTLKNHQKENKIKGSITEEKVEEKNESEFEEVPDSEQILSNLETIRRTYYADYKHLEYVEGDLNKDGISDLVWIMEIPNPHYTMEDDTVYDRKVIFLLRVNSESTDSVKQYRIAAENDAIIECSDCGGAGVGDPYQGVEIYADTVKFNLGYGSCQKEWITLCFIYTVEKEIWYLERSEKLYVDCNRLADDSLSVYTESTIETRTDFGSISFEEYPQF